MSLDERFEILKKKVGGNREVMGFEYTFGMPRETRQRITPVGRWPKRVLSEIEFGLKLNRYGDCPGKWDSVLSDALSSLEQAMASESVLTDTACRTAENILMPMAQAAREYSLILCGHAHIDMNWMWSYNETVAATLSTFGTMLSLMDEYPDFTFSQSQTSVYRIVEEHDPDMMKKIKQRIAEGRWEVTASEWVETDKNMPSGESLVQSVLRTREYFSSVWGLDPDSLCIDFSPDTFGHSRFVPEIDTYSGVRYCYHCRGLDEPYTLYRFLAPSGAEIIMYREPYWYNSAITPHIGIGLPKLAHSMGGLKTGMIVYGVGNHGGGVTRRDIEKALEMQEWPIFPAIRFGSFREFFKLAETVRQNLPVIDRELNFLFTGCYTTQSRIKKGNRKTEAKLVESDYFSTVAAKLGGLEYPYEAYERAWRNTLFTHFHDILTGSCVQDSREYAMGLYQRALADAESAESRALRVLSSCIDCSAVPVEDESPALSQSFGAGVGFGIVGFGGVPNPERGKGLTRVFHVFNPTPYERTEPIDITVWDWAGDLRHCGVTDVDGNPVEWVLLDGDYQDYWDHTFIRFCVRVSLPPFGYKTVVFKQVPLEEYPFNYYCTDRGHLGYANKVVLENNLVRAEIDPLSGAILSFTDLETNQQLIDSTRHAGLVLIDTQDQGMTAWTIGNYLKKTPVDRVINFGYYQMGDLRRGVRFKARVLDSVIHADIWLNKDSRALTVYTYIEWNQLSGETIPLLAFDVPVAYGTNRCLCDVPMGVAERSENNHDIPALTYCTALPEDASQIPVSLMSDTKYGYRFFNRTLTCSLINTPHDPDPAPERGRHEVTLWITEGSAVPSDMAKIAAPVNKPLRWISDNPHPGTLSPDASLFPIDAGSCAVSSISLNREGHVQVRLNELDGRTSTVRIESPCPVTHASMTDLTGREVNDGQSSVTFDGRTLTATLPAHAVRTLEWY